MGTGKVALQLFFTLHVDIFGLELAPSRYVLAASALRELSRASERFTFQEPGDSSVLLDHDYGVRCEFRCASLLDTPVEMLQTASAVVMEVCLPLEVQREASKRLQMCQPGCRIVSYSALHGLVGQDCRLGPVKAESGLTGDGRGGISLAASWKPVGHGFGFYEMAASAEDAAAAWSQATAKLKSEDAVQVDVTGCPSRARRLRYTDDVLADPALAKYPWAKGEKVLVGYSWLPFPDLGEPDDGSAGGLDGVTWMPAYVVCVFEDNFVNVCYEDDGTVEATDERFKQQLDADTTEEKKHKARRERHASPADDANASSGAAEKSTGHGASVKKTVSRNTLLKAYEPARMDRASLNEEVLAEIMQVYVQAGQISSIDWWPRFWRLLEEAGSAHAAAASLLMRQHQADAVQQGRRHLQQFLQHRPKMGQAAELAQFRRIIQGLVTGHRSLVPYQEVWAIFQQLIFSSVHLQPDQSIFQIVIQAFADANDEEGVQEWLSRARLFCLEHAACEKEV
ncbi:unnamed protein product [Symbiodinium sp. KB8]|nr:unnamed protein product [Symbiodinium sp. KB8]